MCRVGTQQLTDHCCWPNRQEVEELSADARRGGRDSRRSFFLMHRMASYRWLLLVCMGHQLGT